MGKPEISRQIKKDGDARGFFRPLRFRGITPHAKCAIMCCLDWGASLICCALASLLMLNPDRATLTQRL